MINLHAGNLRIPRFEKPVYVVAGGMTDFRKRYPEKNASELCADAFNMAVRENDLKVSMQEFKSLVNFCVYSQFADHFGDQLLAGAKIHDYLGLDPLGNIEVKTGGATGGHAVLAGALAAGARLIKQVEVLAIARDDNGFVIETSKGRVRAGRVLNAAGGWSSQVARMVGLEMPARAYPIQMIVTEPVPPLVDHLLAYADRHLTLKQVENGNIIIGGGWRAELDRETQYPKVSRDSFEGNLWVAQRVVPALKHIHVIRSWAALNMSADGAPILGEAPGVPGFYNATTVNGVTLGPLIGQLTANMMRTGQIDPSLKQFSLARFG